MSATDLGPEGRARVNASKRRRRAEYNAWKQTEQARGADPTLFALELERLTGMPRWQLGDGRPVFTNTPAEVAARRKILAEYRKAAS
jgi:hypothetical protein